MVEVSFFQIFLSEKFLELGYILPGLAETEGPEIGIERLVDEILQE